MNTNELKNILTEIEEQLRKHNLWEEKRPHDKAFESNAPFFLDTMSFNQWLQFVLIERFRVMIANNENLPAKLAIFPYAYEIYKDERHEKMELLKVIYRLDKFFAIDSGKATLETKREM